jgi:hypothetical protein
MKKHKQDLTRKEYAKFTKDELLSMFREEAQHICKEPTDVNSIAESALSDFIMNHGKYISL